MELIRSMTRKADQEDGFTLIELMVVVLIIAILIAIAIPTFLGARARAQDRAAQSDIRNGLTAEKTVYTDAQTYSNDTTTAGMKGVESSLQWGTKLLVNVGASSVAATGVNDIVCLQEKSNSGTTFSLVDIAAGPKAGTYFGKAALTTCAEGTVTGMTTSW